MDYFILVNHIVSLIASVWFSNKCCIKCLQEYENDRKQDGTYEKRKAEICNDRIYLSATSLFIKISGVVLTIGFTLLYIIQNNLTDFSKKKKKIVSSGIHIPIILISCGKIISCLFNTFSNKNEKEFFSDSDCKETIFIVTISIDICLFMVNSDLGLWVLAIILGKFIWADFVYNSTDIFNYLKEQIRNIIAAVLSCPTTKSNAIWLDIQYARNYILLFFLLKITYKRGLDLPYDAFGICLCIAYLFYFVFNCFFDLCAIIASNKNNYKNINRQKCAKHQKRKHKNNRH